MGERGSARDLDMREASACLCGETLSRRVHTPVMGLLH